jgi:hypothetical protein
MWDEPHSPKAEQSSTVMDSSSNEIVEASREQWKSVLAADHDRMTSYERIEVEQDVRGKNQLAALSPSVTTTMGLKSLRRKLKRLKETKQHHDLKEDASFATTISTYPKDSVQIKSDRSNRRELKDRILSCQSIIADEVILLRFLLATRLDAEKAVNRLLDYYALAMELFGDAVLTRPILLDDLNRQEKKLLESGWIQLLGTRDAAGRRILTIDEVGPAEPSNILHKVSRRVTVIYAPKSRTLSMITYNYDVMVTWPLL